MRARIKAYPDGDPLRDAASIGLIGALRERLPIGHHFKPEVPVTQNPSDRRAWDGVLYIQTCTCALEFVTRFHECQAQLRAYQLKLRDGSVDRLVVVVKATHANRRALTAARDIVAAAFPASTRHVLAALATGLDPGAIGIVLLNVGERDAQAVTQRA